MPPESQEDRLDRFKRDIAKDADTTLEQRDKANEDMRFVSVDGGQWEDFLENQYTSDRVRAEFDIVSGYKNRTLAEWNANRVGVEYVSDDLATSDDDAELLTGMYRADHRDGGGKRAVKNAVNEALTCGFGAWHIRPVYEDEEDPESEDQRVIWEQVNNAFNTVFFDRSAATQDKSDARWCTLLTPFTKEAFEEQWSDKAPTSAYVPEDRSYLNFNHLAEDYIYIATRYEVRKQRETAYVYNNLATREVEVYYGEDHDKVRDELTGDRSRVLVREKQVVRRHVFMSRFSGDDFLERPRRIAGKHIGIVPVYAHWEYVDGQERYYGLVRKLKDAGRVMNVQISQLIETAAAGGDEIPIFDPEQMEDKNIRDDWSNRTNKSFLMARALRNEDGSVFHAGPIGTLKAPTIGQASVTLMEVVGQFINDMTGGAPQETVDPHASGKALVAVQKRIDRNTAPIFDNIADAVELDGQIYQSLAAEIYDEPGRMVRTMAADGTRGRETLFRAVVDQQTGQIVESTNLRGKKFRAHVDVGPQYETVREQTVETLKGMLEPLANVPAGQQYAQVIVDTILQNVPGIGLGPLKKLSRRSLMLQGLIEPESEEDQEFVASMAQRQGEDPQQAMIAAAVRQALSEARNLDAASAEKAASAELKMAQVRETEADTAKTLSEIRNERARTLADIRKEVLGQAAQGLH